PSASFDTDMNKKIELAKNIMKEKNLKGEALYRAVAKYNEENAPKAPPAQKPPAQKIDPNLLAVDNSFTKGAKNAPVKIYEFSDFQCPFCSRANNTIQEVVKKYEGKVQLVFKAYPLPFHKEAEPAHRAAIAAGKQGKFWEMHDKFFANQGGMKGKGDAGMQSMAEEYASELGLNMDKFKADYSSPEVAKQVKDEMAMGQKVGVRGTPNFFINGTRIVGAQLAPAFEAAIEEALKAKK
ncbi:MAG: thioredoxin domain-containing protein, partial [Myxococcota bacterium]